VGQRLVLEHEFGGGGVLDQQLHGTVGELLPGAGVGLGFLVFVWVEQIWLSIWLHLRGYQYYKYTSKE